MATRRRDPTVWTVVDETDFDLLWCSVDAFAPSPLEPHLAALAQLQEAARQPGPVEAWLRAFDPDAKAVAAITDGYGLKAKPLHELFREQTDSDLTLTMFGPLVTLATMAASFTAQRGKQVLAFIVLKHEAELLTEGLYNGHEAPECSFSLSVAYADKFGQQQSIRAVTWKFNDQRVPNCPKN
jgi:hypothetical protein